MTDWLVARLREPSTWRGIVWLLTALGVSLSPEAWEYVIASGMAIAGLIGVLASDSASPGAPPPPPPPPPQPAGFTDRELNADVMVDRRPAAGQLQRDVPTVPNFGVRPPIDRDLADQFSGGWGDR